MILRSKSRSGSVHLIAVFVVIILVLGVLGYLFWQNIIKSKTISYKTASFSLSSYPSIRFSYPSNWVIKTQMDDYTEIDNPSKGIEIRFQKTDAPSLAFDVCSGRSPDLYSQYHSTKLVGYPDLTYVESIFQYGGGGGYSYEAKLQKTSNQSDSSMLSKLTCRYSNEFYDYNSITGVKTDFSVDIGATNFFTSKGDVVGTVDDINLIKNLFASSDFKTARTILLSGEVDPVSQNIPANK
jgi:hypothetical protein